MNNDIKKSLARSSFGTNKAVAARRTISRADAVKVVALASEMKQAPQKSRKRSGGQSAQRH